MSPASGSATSRTWVAVTRPVASSLALTLSMPLVSSEKLTAICTSPRGAGLRPLSSISPRQGVFAEAAGLTLADAHADQCLLVGRRHEHTLALARDLGIALDDRIAEAVDGFDCERQRRHVDQQRHGRRRARDGHRLEAAESRGRRSDGLHHLVAWGGTGGASGAGGAGGANAAGGANGAR